MAKIIYTTKIPETQEPDAIYYERSGAMPSCGNFGSLDFTIKPTDTKLTFYHAYWSVPARLTDRWGFKHLHYLQMAWTALSFACLKALGQKVELHTDIEGAKVLDFLSYDKVDCTMEALRVHPKYFAAGKMVAMQLAGKNKVYLDSDLFVWDGKVVEKLAGTDNIVSHVEKIENYTNLVKIADLPFKITDTSYNMGIIKLADPASFAKQYFDTMRELIKNKVFKAYTEKHGAVYSPDLICEQLNLRNFVECDTLFNGEDITNNCDEDFGFTHLMAYSKFAAVPQILEQLKRINENIYSGLMDKWKELDFEVVHE